MANTTIALRQSGATGNTPSLGVLANGELSLNYADGILYYKTASNTLGSIRTTQPAGLTKEIQFNDAGSFGTDSDFTYDKTQNRLNVENVIVNSAITIGTASGGILTGANVIYSNTFVANSTTTSTSTTTGAVIVSGGVGIAGNVYAAAVFAGSLNVESTLTASYSKANAANVLAQAAFDKANSANIVAQGAFDKANTDFTNISVTAGTYGNASAIPTITVDANGRISTITTATLTAATIGDALALSIALG